jgi:hypothetical protein
MTVTELMDALNDSYSPPDAKVFVSDGVHRFEILRPDLDGPDFVIVFDTNS